MPNQRSIIVVLAFGALFIASRTPQAQPDLQNQTGLTVLDARGRRVGPVQGFSWTGICCEAIGSSPLVTLKVNGLPVVLAVEPATFVGSRPELLFASDDCSGTPFLDAWKPELRLVLRTAVIRDVVYAETGNPQSLTVKSLIHAAGSVDPFPLYTCRANFAPFDRRAIPAMPVLDTSAHFTPPFSIR